MFRSFYLFPFSYFAHSGYKQNVDFNEDPSNEPTSLDGNFEIKTCRRPSVYKVQCVKLSSQSYASLYRKPRLVQGQLSIFFSNLALCVLQKYIFEQSIQTKPHYFSYRTQHSFVLYETSIIVMSSCFEKCY